MGKKKEAEVRMYSIQLMVATSLEKEELAEVVGAWADSQFIANQKPSVASVNELLTTGSLLEGGIHVALFASREALKCVNRMASQVERLATVTEKLAEVKIT